MDELLFTSFTTAVLVTSIDEFVGIFTIVLSLEVFPSESFPSSLISLTSLVFPGLLAVALTLFIILPLSTAAWVIVNVAV